MPAGSATSSQIAESIGIGSRRRADLAASGLKVMDIYRFAQITDRLDVSIDWLLGRSDLMELPEESRKRA